MYAYIKGTLEEKSTDSIVVETAGIGYKIYVSEHTMQKLGEIGEKVKIYTHYHVREDNISLYGFLSNEELKMFELLLRSKWNRSQHSNSNAFKYNSIKICISNNIK